MGEHFLVKDYHNENLECNNHVHLTDFYGFVYIIRYFLNHSIMHSPNYVRRVVEGVITKCVWENLRQLLGYFKAKFKGDKKPYFKVVNTIA